MSEAALRTIDTEVGERLQAQLATSDEAAPIVPQEVRELIAGFSITRELSEGEIATENERALRVRDSTRQRTEMAVVRRNQLRAKLEQAGLTPLAVLTDAAWARICKAHDLLRFENIDHGGKTSGNFRDFSGRNEALASLFAKILANIGIGLAAYFTFGPSLAWMCAALVFAIAPLGTLLLSLERAVDDEGSPSAFFVASWFTAAMCAGGAVWFSYTGTDLSGATTLVAIAGFVVSVVATLVIHCVDDKPWWQKAVLHGRLSLTSKSRLLRALFPEGCDARSGERFGVRFPKPTAEFTTALVATRTAKLHPMIAAAPKAVFIDRRELFDAESKMIDEEHEARMRAIRNDPILYVKENGMVAVLAQFGEFPKEKELMNTLQKMDFLLLL